MRDLRLIRSWDPVPVTYADLERYLGDELSARHRATLVVLGELSEVERRVFDHWFMCGNKARLNEDVLAALGVSQLEFDGMATLFALAYDEATAAIEYQALADGASYQAQAVAAYRAEASCRIMTDG